jgi:hypothetical protein
MKILCSCCKGVAIETPTIIRNRPGLSAINYRVGSHATFLATMKARLSNHYLEIPTDEFDAHGKAKTYKIYPLQNLRTRDASDPAIALLDAWATLADVLTFYQERIANEGFLRTATERRSILELARLVGYKLRPGVAASVYLAYTLDDKSAPVEIPAGAKSQSVPGPDELPQTFETAEPLPARPQWNLLQPRMSRPQTFAGVKEKQTIWLKGINTNLKVNDRLLVVDDDEKVNSDNLVRITAIKPDATNERTEISVLPDKKGGSKGEKFAGNPAKNLLDSLKLSPLPTLTSSLQLERNANQSFALQSENNLKLLKEFHPEFSKYLSAAWANAEITPSASLKVYAFRLVAPLFGYNAAKRINILQGGGIDKNPVEWEIIVGSPSTKLTSLESEDTLFLDSAYDKILQGSWVVVDTSELSGEDFTERIKRADGEKLVTTVADVSASSSRAEYGLAGKTTRIKLKDRWLKIDLPEPPDTPPVPVLVENTAVNTNAIVINNSGTNEFQIVRRTMVYAQSEELELAEEPITKNICSHDEDIELDGFYSSLQSGRLVIISGERVIEGTSGVETSELAMLASVSHHPQQVFLKDGTRQDLRGDKRHTFIKLDQSLNAGNAQGFCYKRDTVKIYGNVVKATNGETRNEVLGSGDASKALQRFILKQPPLTFVSAPTTEGIESTLHVRVNDVEWHETDSLAELLPNDRKFITLTDDEATTTLVFGNGKQGARLPTGIENITAVYRNGIGKGGNVKPEQISLLMTKPLGVKEVINPLRASGGADKESRDLARSNAPLAVMALDRLVSTQDYADFARTFAGVGKAAAVRLSNGQRQIVHLTIAGVDDIPIDKTSDLYNNLRQALHKFGDPYQAIQIDVRELVTLVISAKVRILPDYLWDKVEPKIRAALLRKFSFDNRQLAQAAFLSEVITTMQKVEGVAYADVDVFDSIDEAKLRGLLESQDKKAPETETANANQNSLMDELDLTLNQAINVKGGRFAAAGIVKAAQLAFLTANVRETLILNLIKEMPK